MSYFCPDPSCEGWEIFEGDNFCPNCGTSVRQGELWLEEQSSQGWVRTPVLSGAPARLHICLQGPQSQKLDFLFPPPGMNLNLPDSLLPGQPLRIPLQLEQLPPSFQLGSLQVYYCSEPRLQLRTRSPRVDPDLERLEVELEVLEGAYYLDRLPQGWSGTLPQLLSSDGQRSCWLEAPAQAELELAGCTLKVPRAGRLHVDLPEFWDCRYQPQLELLVEALEGPVDLDWVESDCSAVHVVDWPRQLGCGRIGLECQEALHQDVQLTLHTRHGRKLEVTLCLRTPEPEDFPGWLLLDWGSFQVSAALLEADGQLSRIEVEARGLGALRRELGLTSPQYLSDEFRFLWEKLRGHPNLRHKKISRLVLTHPAALTPRQLHDFREAVSRHWSGQLVLLSEPLAAAYHFLTHRPGLPKGDWKLLLWDVGGSTCDAALLRVRVGQQIAVEVEEVGGDAWFGGQDITDLLAGIVGPDQDAEAIKCSQPPRAELDPLIRPRLHLGLPGTERPQLLVLSGRGSQYPLLGEWLQSQFAGVALARVEELKWGVVLGARYAPEVVASLGPRQPRPGQNWLHFERPTQQIRCGTRLGLKLQGAQGAEFRLLTPQGQTLPHRQEVTGLAWVYGENGLEVVENLGWSDAYRTPEGQLNRTLVTLRRLHLELPHTPVAGETRLLWQLSSDYSLLLEVWEGSERLAALGPVALW